MQVEANDTIIVTKITMTISVRPGIMLAPTLSVPMDAASLLQKNTMTGAAHAIAKYWKE